MLTLASLCEIHCNARFRLNILSITTPQCDFAFGLIAFIAATAVRMAHSVALHTTARVTVVLNGHIAQLRAVGPTARSWRSRGDTFSIMSLVF